MTIPKLTKTGKVCAFGIGLAAYAAHISLLIHLLSRWLPLVLGLEAFACYTAIIYFLFFDHED